jgi:putative SOS response-associated peptidase YedK
MCGRFALAASSAVIQEELHATLWRDADLYLPSFNLAPTQNAVVLLDGGSRELSLMRWGLIPRWSKDQKTGAPLINARLETIHQKPSFRSLVNRRRCAVVAEGWYEWQRRGSGKIPYYMHAADGGLLLLAGLWDTWQTPEGESLHSCTVVTTTPYQGIAHIHDRMPLLLGGGGADAWLDCDTSDLNAARAAVAETLVGVESYAVSTYVNAVRNASEKCREPVPVQDELF